MALLSYDSFPLSYDRKIIFFVQNVALTGAHCLQGNGTCGHVVEMRHKDSGRVIAVKQGPILRNSISAENFSDKF
jgi:hypothetical protein